MTLGEGKRKVYMLLDEYSSGGTVTEDADIEARMADFFDIGQKQVAEIKHIRRSLIIERTAGQTLYPMPKDFLRLIRVWRGDTETKRYRWRRGMIASITISFRNRDGIVKKRRKCLCRNQGMGLRTSSHSPDYTHLAARRQWLNCICLYLNYTFLIFCS